MFHKTARASLALTLAAGLAFAQTGTPPGTPGTPGSTPGTPPGRPSGVSRGISRTAPAVRYDNSPRVHELIRAGNLYLSLGDALALAIENNLDIELQRYLLPLGDTELLRAKGGGLTRGLNFTLAEVPTGTGGPLSPVLTTAASAGRATAGSSVATSALGLNVLGQPQVNGSIQGTVPQSTGTAIPNYDPAVTGQLNWTHQTTPQTSAATTGTSTLVTGTTLFNAGVQQGFASGAQVGLNFNNSRTSLNSQRAGYNPYTGSTLGFTATQPLLRGFGASLNRRFIRIAGNEQKITSLLFQQQLILTVYGVIRLYTDLVALVEDEKVKQETVAPRRETALRRAGAGGRRHARAGGDDARQRAGVFHPPGLDQCPRPARGAGSHLQERRHPPWQRRPRGGRRPRHPHRHPIHRGLTGQGERA